MLQDSLAKKFTSHFLPDKVHESTNLLEDGLSALQKHRQTTPTLDYLEGIANVRFALSVVAEVLQNEESRYKSKELLEAGEKLCSDREINHIDTSGKTNTVGPVIYLLKLIVRQYGLPSLRAAAENHEWIIPAELKSVEVLQLLFLY